MGTRSDQARKEYMRVWYNKRRADREFMRARARVARDYANRPEAKAKRAERSQRDLELVIEHYGQECVCCHEQDPGFLLPVHKNWTDKTRYSGGRASWIVAHNFPPQFELRCMNCAYSRERFEGKCAHQVVGTELEHPVIAEDLDSQFAKQREYENSIMDQDGQPDTEPASNKAGSAK